MNIAFFNRKYIIRRFDEQKETLGYLRSSYRDIEVDLHVHPSGNAKVSTQEFGQRRVQYLEGHGNQPLQMSDEATGKKADLLRYDNRWYECTSCVRWDRTILSHWNYTFVLVPEDKKNVADLKAPDSDPFAVEDGRYELF